MGPRTHRARFALAVFLLVALTAAVYAPVLHYGFVSLDDPFFTTERFHGGLTPENIRWAFSEPYAGFFAPLSLLSHMLDFQLYGDWAGGHHLTNLLLHLASTLLLMGCLAKATGAPWRSFFVAALFALHPLHVESVAWVAERKDALSTTLALLTLLAYLRYAARPSPTRYFLVFSAFAAALLAKSMVMTLPFLLLLLDYWPLRRLDREESPSRWGIAPTLLARRAAEKLPLVALSLLSVWLTFAGQAKLDAFTRSEFIPFGDRVANAVLSYGRYLGRMVWPAELAVYYPHPQSAYSGGLVALTLLLLVAVTSGVLWAARRHPHLPVGWLWYLGTLVPVIGLVQVGLQSSADRYTYLPLVGVFLLLVWSAGTWLEDRRPLRFWTAAMLAAALLLPLAFLARRQVETWRSSEALFRNTLAHYPKNPLVLVDLGTELGKGKRYEEAVECFEAAGHLTRVIPADADLNWAMALSELGRYEEAAGRCRGILARDARSGRAHFLLAFCLSQLQRYAEALPHYREAFALGGTTGERLVWIGDIYRKGGLCAEAVEVYTIVPPSDPASSRAAAGLEACRASSGG